jgi:hypothetical protein
MMLGIRSTFAGLVIGLIIPVAASAQLRPCTQTATGDKVYLDDVRARSAQDAAALDTLVRRVGYKVAANLAALEARSGPGLRVLSCTARFPNGDADFTPTLSKNLTTEKVLLEVWSEVHREVDDAGDPFLVVDLSVALVPMLAKPQPGTPGGVVRFQTRFKPGASVVQVLKGIEAREELWGLARVSAGMRSYGLGQYKVASAILCEGVRSLRALKAPARRASCATLADFADQAAAEARDRFKASGDLPAFVSAAAQCAVTP